MAFKHIFKCFSFVQYLVFQILNTEYLNTLHTNMICAQIDLSRLILPVSNVPKKTLLNSQTAVNLKKVKRESFPILVTERWAWS